MLARIGAQDFETPAGDRPPRRLGVAGVAVEHRRKPLLIEQHLQRLA